MAAASTPMMEKASAGMREIFSALSSSESRYFDEERYSESEIRKALNDNLTDRKIDAMKRILAAVSVGRDASPLFPDVVKNVSFQSLELKKLIYIYLVQYAENNRELALLSINSFQKDLSDRSQQVRASALRAMASIKVLEVIQLVMAAVKSAASDMSPYVRKTAAQCMTKVYAVDPDQFIELRTLLLKLMNDVEVQVVGSAGMAFRQICIIQPPRALVQASGEDGPGTGGASGPDAAARSQLELLHQNFKRLCQDVLLMDSWAQQSCIDLLMRYSRIFFACPDRQVEKEPSAGDGASGATNSPTVSEDLTLFLRALKLMLNSSSKGVTLASAVALCYLAPSQELSSVAMPLLRCLRQAPPESAASLLTAVTPLIEVRPDLFRPMIRDFFIQSFDSSSMKASKLKIIELLVDESNVQLILRELQAYVSWHSYPEFVALSVQSIAHVALKIPSVADACLRALVKMLDSKCGALSCEAVVSLRALLQRRQRSEDSGLSTVLPHLVAFLEDLKAPTARASVVWIIGQYQREVPRLAPDVLRRMAKTFAGEPPEVKQQILVLGLKVWAFHTLNSQGDSLTGQKENVAPPEDQASHDAAGSRKSAPKTAPRVSSEESAQILARLEGLVDHIYTTAAFDVAWDVRDSARALKRMKGVAKAALNSGSEGGNAMEKLGAWYCRSCVSGTAPVDADGVDASLLQELAASSSSRAKAGGGATAVESTWILGSLAQALDFPLETYCPLPGWAEENSPDELRKVKVEVAAALAAKRDEPQSLSSSNVGAISHMEQRVQLPSNIKNVPVAQSLEDLDLFYSEAPSTAAATVSSSSTAKLQRPSPAASEPSAPTSLEQMRLGGPLVSAPVGTAVFGEDDESDEEDEEEGDDDDWKYCPQANETAAPPPETVAPAAVPPATAVEATAVEAPAPSTAVAVEVPPAAVVEAPAVEAPAPTKVVEVPPATAVEAPVPTPTASTPTTPAAAPEASAAAAEAAVPKDFFDPPPREAPSAEDSAQDPSEIASDLLS